MEYGRFLVSMLRVGSMGGVDCPLVFLLSGNSIYRRFWGGILLDNYELPEVYFTITNKKYYIYGVTWAKMVGFFTPQIYNVVVKLIFFGFLFWFL